MPHMTFHFLFAALVALDLDRHRRLTLRLAGFRHAVHLLSGVQKADDNGTIPF